MQLCPCQFVVLLFWSIFTYDRELVYPASIDTFFPPWINHAMVCETTFLALRFKSDLDYPTTNNLTRRVVPTLFSQHTLVLPVLLGELLVQPHAYPEAKHAMAALGVVGLSYSFW